VIVIYGILIRVARKIIPTSRFRSSLGRKFEKQYSEYKKKLENPSDFSYCTNKEMQITFSLLEKCIKSGLEGDVIECGVYMGGSSIQIAKKLVDLDSKKKLYALDTFEGHPYDDESDMPEELKKEVYGIKSPQKRKGMLNDVNLDKVKKNFMKENLDNTIFLKGLFEESFKKISDKKFCFAHVDADFYLSVKQCIEFLKDRMVSKGIILFDDYNSPGYLGCNKAIDDLLGRSSLKLLKHHRAYWVKP